MSTTAAKPYTIERYEDERAWKRARLTGVGASEAAAVVRLSKFQGEFGLYWRKIEGRVEDEEGDANLGAMAEWGHRHEPALSEWFRERTDHGMFAIHDPGDYTIFRSVERPHMFATVDRMVTGPLHDRGPYPLELKASWFSAAREWGARIPIGFQCQLQMQLYVTGATAGFFAVLLNGYDARWYRMERHDRFIKRLCDRVDAFWDRVVRRDPPEPDGHKASLAKLFELHPEASAREVVDLPTELAACGAAWDAAAQAEKDAQRRKDEIKARVMARIGDATHARLPDDSGFAWTNTARGRQFRRVERVADQEQ